MTLQYELVGVQQELVPLSCIYLKVVSMVYGTFISLGKANCKIRISAIKSASKHIPNGSQLNKPQEKNKILNMKSSIITFISILSFSFAFGQSGTKTTQSRIVSKIDSTYSNEIVLIQEFTVKVPLDSVWNAYTTKKRLGICICIPC